MEIFLTLKSSVFFIAFTIQFFFVIKIPVLVEGIIPAAKPCSQFQKKFFQNAF